jgi:hypothetical protein
MPGIVNRLAAAHRRAVLLLAARDDPRYIVGQRLPQRRTGTSQVLGHEVIAAGIA